MAVWLLLSASVLPGRAGWASCVGGEQSRCGRVGRGARRAADTCPPRCIGYP